MEEIAWYKTRLANNLVLIINPVYNGCKRFVVSVVSHLRKSVKWENSAGAYEDTLSFKTHKITGKINYSR